MSRHITKLWNKDFSLLMIVQVIALFANSIITFVLPLYILQISGSPALFGTVLALASVPIILMSPIGGVLADRNKRQRIMLWMDISTTAVILIFIAASGITGVLVPIIIIKLIALNIIQGIYMPAAMSAVRFLVPEDKLLPANAAVNMVFSLSNAVGPVVGTILFANFGIMPILTIGVIIFAICAVIDLFIRIPFTKKKKTESIISLVKTDLARCARFGIKEKPAIGKLTLIIFLYSIPTIAMVFVAFPILITQTLEMSEVFLGLSQGIMMGGGLLGGILAGTLGKRFPINKAHIILLLCSLLTFPMGLVFMLEASTAAAYVVVTLSGTIISLSTQIVLIQILAYVQLETPVALVGKVVAFVMALAIAAYPLGQFLFGLLLDILTDIPWVALYISAIMSSIIAGWSIKHFEKMK